MGPAMNSSVERVLIETQAQAIITALGKKKGEKFIRAWAAALVEARDLSEIIPLRGDRSARSPETHEAAAAWMSTTLPRLVRGLRR
ncbi:MAG: hypothetical protein Q7T23_09065 [Phenylobacterium sp.]|nr:hypothetical protein [Phenylobacterium sp.]